MLGICLGYAWDMLGKLGYDMLHPNGIVNRHNSKNSTRYCVFRNTLKHPGGFSKNSGGSLG
eukprot:361956-Prorocentrum_minimum.AAC.1